MPSWLAPEQRDDEPVRRVRGGRSGQGRQPAAGTDARSSRVPRPRSSETTGSSPSGCPPRRPPGPRRPRDGARSRPGHGTGRRARTSAAASAPSASASRTFSSPGWRGDSGSRSGGRRRRSENMVAMHHGRGAHARVHDRGQPRGRRPGLPPRHPPGRRRLSAHRRVPAELHVADGERCVPDPEDRVRVHARWSRTRRRSAPSAAPGDPRRPRRSSGRSTCSPPRSASIPADVRRAELHPARRIPVHDRLRRGLRLRRLRARARPRTRRGRLRGTAGRAAAPPREEWPAASSGSASAHTSRSRTASPRKSSARSRSRRTARRSSARARSPTDRGTRRRSP